MKKSVMSADGSSAISGASRWLAACAASGAGPLTTPNASAQTPANATSAYAVLLAMPTSLSGVHGRAMVAAAPVRQPGARRSDERPSFAAPANSVQQEVELVCVLESETFAHAVDDRRE